MPDQTVVNKQIGHNIPRCPAPAELDHRLGRARVCAAADAAEVETPLDEIGRHAHEMTLIVLKGAIIASEIGFDGPAADYIEPCFSTPDEWCSHNLPEAQH